MMIITEIEVKSNYQLQISVEDGRVGLFDVSPYLKSEAFIELKSKNNFTKIYNGKYFIEWDCGADLSTDTIESKWEVT